MEILTAEELRKADQYTIEHEPISSINLMERAATTFFHRMWELVDESEMNSSVFDIICANGNNGGDALVIARLLAQKKVKVNVFILDVSPKTSPDFFNNLARLKETDVSVKNITKNLEAFQLTKQSIIIDGIFGSGLSRPIEGGLVGLVNTINQSGNTVFSIDMPSGLFADRSSKGQTIVRASFTLSFEYPKLAFFLPECQEYIGKWEVIPIGLKTEFLQKSGGTKEAIDRKLIQSFFKKRNRFSHKGTYGHAIIYAGSEGRIGAAILCGKAALRSGLGLLTLVVPNEAKTAIHTALPEAMLFNDTSKGFAKTSKQFQAIGIGPGLSTDQNAATVFLEVIKSAEQEMVIDADALNLLATNKEWLAIIPKNSILTPHPKEFERLVGPWENDFERLEKLITFAEKYQVNMVLKDAYTCIVTSKGKCYFNLIGNAGMATAGSGDVLTGICTGLLAQGYTAEQSAVLGVYVHALAGDIAVEKVSQTAMIAGDIIDNLGSAFKTFE